VADGLGELLFAALRDYRPTLLPHERLGKPIRRARLVLDRPQKEVPASFNCAVPA
jgi:hypothetical protein